MDVRSFNQKNTKRPTLAIAQKNIPQETRWTSGHSQEHQTPRPYNPGYNGLWMRSSRPVARRWLIASGSYTSSRWQISSSTGSGHSSQLLQNVVTLVQIPPVHGSVTIVTVRTPGLTPSFSFPACILGPSGPYLTDLPSRGRGERPSNSEIFGSKYRSRPFAAWAMDISANWRTASADFCLPELILVNSPETDIGVVYPQPKASFF